MNNNNYLSDTFTAVGWIFTIYYFILSLPSTKKKWKGLSSMNFDMYLGLFVFIIFILLRHYIF